MENIDSEVCLTRIPAAADSIEDGRSSIFSRVETREEGMIVLRKKEFLTLVEAAFYLNRKPQTLYNWMKLGRAPRRFKRDGRWEFKPKDLDAYIKTTRQVFEAFQ